MRLVLLTALTMCAFASNSLLTRLAIDGGHADPFSFAVVRVLAGVLVLLALLYFTSDGLPKFDASRAKGAISLAVYMVGFSVAYISLDAGLGALILFGVVQITMFVQATWSGATPTARQFLGAGVAFAGLMLVLWPGAESSTDILGASAMICAGLGWGLYTISGRGAREPLAATAASFTLCLPVLGIALAPFLTHVSVSGWLLAIVCGGLTSGLGYALWYRVLPDLPPAVAAVVQLSVPVLAILAGAVLLGENVTTTTVAAAAMVLAGIALATRKRSSPEGRS